MGISCLIIGTVHLSVSRSAQFSFKKASVLRLGGAFCGVNIAINYLQVWQAPIA
jgi:hypothetical protein